jgi:anti-sigma B factor antagonist
MEGIQVTTQAAGSHNQISLIKVGGYIDTTTSSEVERELNNLLKQRRYQIIIDLGNVDYISSAGWGIFISEIKQIRENNGDLKLVRMIPDVYEIFELLEFHHILDVYDTPQAAISKFEESQYVEMVSSRGSESQETSEFSSSAPPQNPTVSRMDTSHAAEGAPRPSKPAPSEAPPRQQPAAKKPTILDLVNMSVEDKIRYIVAKDPSLGAYRIHKRLNSPDFGFTRVSWLGVRSWLKKLGLNSRDKRHKFAASYRNQ